ncbi:unnamed protein product [Arabidopsis thaliana]|uniref:Uncharacterized protein n=3 Tax=Arabidopsis TaxID=3701 RepID=A0A654EWY5_ARATH|nr:uncharacterized protein AT2G28426 [Arabidopsis thaliana]AEC08121.1 hypothetical protein AT2G28426 [Arabidopsis thaliana]KAG7637764.1 hypothetical protein ISN45_At02g022570 [Arabidopsis thaliana x Arabidopsis arenosa]CAA0372879.1 unnamed protein product [Arabidopsis thaliana]VYS53786.1 unnamed protein product [Arabidopsis thaliana]|eukprot:NP_001118401.1 hypothetical protein AT2G28426 [Arabidopsis thaliana]
MSWTGSHQRGKHKFYGDPRRTILLLESHDVDAILLFCACAKAP